MVRLFFSRFSTCAPELDTYFSQRFFKQLPCTDRVRAHVPGDPIRDTITSDLWCRSRQSPSIAANRCCIGLTDSMKRRLIKRHGCQCTDAVRLRIYSFSVLPCPLPYPLTSSYVYLRCCYFLTFKVKNEWRRGLP